MLVLMAPLRRQAAQTNDPGQGEFPRDGFFAARSNHQTPMNTYAYEAVDAAARAPPAYWKSRVRARPCAASKRWACSPSGWPSASTAGSNEPSPKHVRTVGAGDFRSLFLN